MRRLLLIPLVLLALLAAAMVWSGGGTERRADFAYINRGDIFTLDLNPMSYMQDFRLTYAIREGLYSPDPYTFRPTPAGATRYDLSDDKRVWTFHLRPEAKWGNGDPVRAQDYVFSWRRLLEDPGEYTYLFYYITNAESYKNSYAKGQPIPWSDVGIEVVDDLTLRVTLRDPVTYLLELMAFPPFYPRHEPSMRPFRNFTDTPIVDRLRKYLAAAKKVDPAAPSPAAAQSFARFVGRDPAAAPDAGALAAFAAKTRTFDLELAELAQVLDVLTAFAALDPFGGSPAAASSSGDWRDAEQASRLRQLVQFRFAPHSYRADYTRPPKYKGGPGVVTNGPFNLTRWDFKRRLILEKSPTYWNRAAVKSERIENVINENPLNQFLLYESGAVDWLSEVPGDLAAELKAKGRTDLRVAPAFGTFFLTLMCRPDLPASFGGGKNPLADVRVRQALAMSVDKQFVVDYITRMGELPARTYLPPDGTLPDFRWLPGPYDTTRGADRPYTPEEVRELLKRPPGPAGPGLPYDVARARQLLAEAGYPNGQGFPPLPILFNAENTQRLSVAQAVKSQWKQALNIDLEIQQIEGKIFKERVSRKDYVIATVAWYGDYPDASTFTDKYLSTSLQNDSAWVRPPFDALCAKASKEGDAAARVKILSQAEHMIDTEMPIIPIYHYVNLMLQRDNVKGLVPNPRNLTVFRDIHVEK